VAPDEVAVAADEVAVAPDEVAVAADEVRLGFDRGDVVIVTGAASGIGKATAISAAAVGLRVAAWDLDRDGAEATVREIRERGGDALAVGADVTDDGQVQAALDASEASLGAARYLVNNAGPSSAVAVPFEAGLLAGIGSVRRVTEAWLARTLPAGPALVNVASVAGNLIGTAPDWYPATKAAIMGYTRHLAAYSRDRVRANAVAPGMTDTPRLAGFTVSEIGQRVLQRIPAGRMARPDEIGWAILFLLSPLASYICGALLVVDGGWTVTQ
jgi:NAD(P)-dependent dehydrogenase (short-subunit alcohol dehydrogenase family)